MESKPASEMTMYYVPAQLNPKFTPSGSTAVVSDATFRKLGRIITDYIGDSENVFVLDAAVGAHRLGEVNVRVITNSANVNLYLKHMLPRQARATVKTFIPNWTVYVAPELSVQDLQSLGLKSNNFAISNLERAILFIGGTNSNQAIREAISAAVTSRALQDNIPALGVTASVVLAKNGKSALVFDPSSLLAQLQLKATPAAAKVEAAAESSKAAKGKKASAAAAEAQTKALFTAQLPDGVVGLHGAIWNHYGLFRMFQGITHHNEKVPRQRADLVELVKNEKGHTSTHITQPLKDLPNFVPLPAALVFLIEDQNALLPALSKLSPAQAAKFFSVGYSGAKDSSLLPFYHPRPLVSQPGAIDSLFNELLAANNTQVFVVNTKRKDGSALTSSQIDTLLAAATDGSLAAAKTTKDAVFNYETISKVDGVAASLDITQGWDKKDYATQAAKLASILSA